MTKIKTNKIILTILIVLSFLFAQNTLFLSLFNKGYSAPVFAETQQGTHVSTLSTISNSDFNTTSSGSATTTSSYYTGSTSIRTPSSWTKDLKAPYPSSLKMGVVNLSEGSNYGNYGLNSVGKSIIYTDSKSAEKEHSALMINSETNRTFGFLSNSFDLDANSFYSITFNYFTKNDTVASVFLKNSDGFIENSNANFVELSSNQTWKTSTFYIATSSTSKLSSLQLYLCLGVPSTSEHTMVDSSGFVLFDNIIVKRYSQLKFDELSNNVNILPEQNKLLSLNHDYAVSGDAGFVENGNFKNALNGWTVYNNSQTGNAFYTVANLATFEGSEYGLSSTFTPGTNYSSSTEQNALLVVSSNKQGSVTLQSSATTIKAQQIFRISVWAKGLLSTGEVVISLSGTNPNAVPNEDDKDANLLSKSFTSLATTTNAYANNWNEYVFYVTGNPLYDCTDVKISLGIKDAIGYVVFDDIRTQLISYSDKTSGTAVDSSVQSLDLFSESNHTVSNANFNTFVDTSANQAFPKTPASWTKLDSTSKTNDVSGVVNTKTTYYNAFKNDFGSPVNPGLPSSVGLDIDEPNNVLMMYNTYSNSSYQAYETANTISLSADSYYLLTVEVCTLSDISGLGGISIEISNADDIVLQKLTNIRTDGAWRVAQIYIHNGSVAQTATITLSFGSEQNPVRGWAFFDNCEVETSDEEAFKAAKANNLTAITEVSSTSATTYSPTEKALQSLYTPLYYQSNIIESTEQDSSRAGILTLQNQASFFGDNYNLGSENDLLVIQAYNDIYQTFSSKFNYSFESGSFYKVTVDVKTIGLTQSPQNTKYDNDGNAIAFGASISIDGFDKQFTGINTAPKNSAYENPFLDEDNKFVTYTFYLNPTETVEGKLTLGIGSSDALTSGWVFFDNISIEKIDEDVYTNETSTFDEDGIPETVISIVNNTTSSEDDDNPSSAFGNSFDWYAIPTIIIAIAVLITVIGFIVRKHQANKTEKVKVAVSYDRSETLLKDMDSRHRKSAINHRLKLLYEELETTEDTLRKEKAEHAKQESAYQTAKEIAKQNPNVELEEPDSKFANFEETVSQLESNIEAIKADIKGLESEKQRYIDNEKRRLEKASQNTVTRTKVQRKKIKIKEKD